MTNLIGTNANQVPTNGMLGTMAYQDADSPSFGKVVTPTGTTGAQTINKTCGSVNFAAAATSLVVTNSLVTANSVIICTVGTDDTTLDDGRIRGDRR